MAPLLAPAVCTATVDFAATAALHAQLAGVLAGFGLAAVAFMLTPIVGRARQTPTSEVSAYSHLVVTLFCALLSLVVTSFMFTVIAGAADGTGARTAGASALATMAFAVSIFTLLYVVVGVVETTGLTQAARDVRAILALGAPALAMLLVGLAVTDAAQADAQLVAAGASRCVPADATLHRWSVVWLPLLVFVVSVGLVVARRWGPVKRWELPHPQNPITRDGFGKLSLVCVAALGAWSAALGSRAVGWVAVPVLWVITVLFAALLIGQTVVLVFGSPRAGGALLEVGRLGRRRRT